MRDNHKNGFTPLEVISKNKGVKNRKNKLLTGFTIIELIVVVSIISLLASIVLANVNGYIKKAKDAKRIADISQVMKALTIYRTMHDSFPHTIAGGCGKPLDGSDAISAALKADNIMSNPPSAVSGLGVCGNAYYVYTFNTNSADDSIYVLTSLDNSSGCKGGGVDYYNSGFYCYGATDNIYNQVFKP